MSNTHYCSELKKMPLEGGEKNRAYGNRAKNISVNDQSSNSIENYVNSVTV